jgi:hypothetical protein
MTVLQQADDGPAIELVAKATRRERLYSSHLTTWRAARERGELLEAPA